MKRTSISLTLLTGLCLSGAVGLSEIRAENPFEKFVPRGKLLKMLKDEITGEVSKPAKPDPRRAPPTRTNAPTPAARTDHAQRSTPMPVSNRATMAARNPERPHSLPQVAPKAGNMMAAKQNGAANRGAGFGMMVQSPRDGQFIVTAVQRGGNAYRAGLRPGDKLISIGGGPLNNLAELKQIAQSLGQGDQVEVELISQGKKRKSLLQFGQPPEEGPTAVAQAPHQQTGNPGTSDSSMPSVLDAPVEHISRLEPLPTSEGASLANSSGKISSLNQTIEEQQTNMKAMAEELRLLRKAHQPAVAPTENSWSFPDLAGPGSN